MTPELIYDELQITSLEITRPIRIVLTDKKEILKHLVRVNSLFRIYECLSKTASCTENHMLIKAKHSQGFINRYLQEFAYNKHGYIKAEYETPDSDKTTEVTVRTVNFSDKSTESIKTTVSQSRFKYFGIRPINATPKCETICVVKEVKSKYERVNNTSKDFKSESNQQRPLFSINYFNIIDENTKGSSSIKKTCPTPQSEISSENRVPSRSTLSAKACDLDLQKKHDICQDATHPDQTPSLSLNPEPLLETPTFNYQEPKNISEESDESISSWICLKKDDSLLKDPEDTFELKQQRALKSKLDMATKLFASIYSLVDYTNPNSDLNKDINFNTNGPSSSQCVRSSNDPSSQEPASVEPFIESHPIASTTI